MRKVFTLIILSTLCWISFLACKNSGSTSSINNDYNEADYHTMFDRERYMIPDIDGIYIPSGLKKMTMLENIQFWKNGGKIETLPFKNFKGDPIPWDSVTAPNLKLIVQMYQNDSGKIAAAVVFPVNDELISKIRAGYKSDESDNSTLKLKDRFIIPTPPGAYAPRGLRKLSLLEMMKYGEDGRINTSFIKRNDKGEIVGEDYYTSGPNNRYMQAFVDEDGVVKEAVIYEMTDEISALFTLLRFSKPE